MKLKRYKSSDEFGRSLGLNKLEMELIRQKKQIIEKLKKTRAQKNISQKSLAELVGSRQPAIARMESGQIAEVSLDFLCKIALALEVSITIKSVAA